MTIPMTFSAEVAAARKAGTAIVALESTIITHGMPWPQNLEVARTVEADIRAAGAVLGESKNAVELREGDYPPVIYFPRDDIALAFLDKTDKTTHCPGKGDASYYSIVNKSSVVENAVWSYEDPIEEVAAIKGYLAFYQRDGVTVEQL